MPFTDTCEGEGCGKQTSRARVVGGGKVLCPECYAKWREEHGTKPHSGIPHQTGQMPRSHRGQMVVPNDEKIKRQNEAVKQRKEDEVTNTQAIRERAMFGKRGRPGEK